MSVQEQIERIWANLLKLGSRRLIALGMIGVSVFVMTGLAGYFLSRPAFEVLYAGLYRQDVSRIAGALKEADIPFDVIPMAALCWFAMERRRERGCCSRRKACPNSPTRAMSS